MMIHGLSFLSLSASFVLPWALTGLVGGQKITGSVVRDVPQSSTVPEKTLPNRKLISQVRAGTTYYVSGSGNDRNSGLTTSSPFRTIQRAANLTNPGDNVLIMNGVYRNSSPTGIVLRVSRSGRANAWITYKAYPGHSPKIQFNGWHGVYIQDGTSYIEVNGLEVQGNNDNITLSYALSQRTNRTNARTNGNCVTIWGRGNLSTHHIRILNNKIYDCGGAGISGIESDYLTLDGNEVYNNAWYGAYGTSGISLLNNFNYDNSQNYKIFVTNNRVYNNRMYIPAIQNGKIQDGHGIIVDRSRNNQVGSRLSPYRGRILIANNVAYNNGGSGIHAYQSDHIDMVHNTTYLNGQTPGLSAGEIMSNYGSDVKILNNIAYGPRGERIIISNRSTNITVNYNLYNNNGSRGNAVGPNDIMADPQFVNASGRDFRVRTTSPAINSGLRFPNLTTDFLGGPRVRGSASDRGAYEIR